ncbi:MAG: type IVB secretion system protein IcmJDotN [Pseudomonadota bacterium]|nr:type IVB secretion system protein IcmJDotN [Pseudomonadota bacterium]
MAIELSLNTQPHVWRMFSARKADSAFQKFAEKVHARDEYTCQYCGFQARHFQQVVNRDNDYRNSKLSNLMTACVFCTQCLFIEAVDYNDYGGGTLIYLPEMTQAELNGLCHVLFCAIANATSYRADAQTIYRNLKFRQQIVEQSLGEGMSNPARLGQMLIDAPLEHREQTIDKVLKDLRLLPSRTKFDEQIKMWAEAALDELAA